VKSPSFIACARVNGAISTMPVISSGASAAAMVAAPPEMEWPTRVAGPPRWRISATRSPAMSVRVYDGHAALDSPQPRRSAEATRYPAATRRGVTNRYAARLCPMPWARTTNGPRPATS
jgi:hypothetical protein